MPEHHLGARRLRIDADLDFQVGDSRGFTSAHLGRSAGGGLVLDVPEPVVFRRVVGARRLSAEFPAWLPPDALDDVAVQVRSAGRNLGRVEPRPGGGLRLRPSPAGLVVGAKVVVSSRYFRQIGAMVAAALVLVIRHRITGRRGASAPPLP